MQRIIRDTTFISLLIVTGLVISAFVITVITYPKVISLETKVEGLHIIINVTNGTDGKNGTNGINGINGTDGKDGRNGTDGKDGINGTDGKDGKNGTDGKDGLNGTNGAVGPTGLTGQPGEPGPPGSNSPSGGVSLPTISGRMSKFIDTNGTLMNSIYFETDLVDLNSTQTLRNKTLNSPYVSNLPTESINVEPFSSLGLNTVTGEVVILSDIVTTNTSQLLQNKNLSSPYIFSPIFPFLSNVLSPEFIPVGVDAIGNFGKIENIATTNTTQTIVLKTIDTAFNDILINGQNITSLINQPVTNHSNVLFESIEVATAFTPPIPIEGMKLWSFDSSISTKWLMISTRVGTTIGLDLGLLSMNRLVQFPDADGVLVYTTTTQDLFNKSFINDVFVKPDFPFVSSVGTLRITTGGAPTKTSTLVPGHSDDATITMPYATSTLATIGLAETLSNKILNEPDITNLPLINPVDSANYIPIGVDTAGDLARVSNVIRSEVHQTITGIKVFSNSLQVLCDDSNIDTVLPIGINTTGTVFRVLNVATTNTTQTLSGKTLNAPIITNLPTGSADSGCYPIGVCPITGDMVNLTSLVTLSKTQTLLNKVLNNPNITNLISLIPVDSISYTPIGVNDNGVVAKLGNIVTTNTPQVFITKTINSDSNTIIVNGGDINNLLRQPVLNTSSPTFATLILTTGLVLPTSGGTPGTLNYYENGVFTITWVGAISTSQGVGFTRIGNTVTFRVVDLVTPAIANSVISGSGIPARLRPATWGPSFLLAVMDNSVFQTLPGMISVFPSDLITLSKDLTGASFTNSGNAGFRSFSITYNIN